VQSVAAPQECGDIVSRMCSIGLDASMHNARRIREGAIDLKIRAPVADGRFDDWREAFGRVFLRLDILPKGEMFNTDVSLRAMPGLGLGSITTSACSLSRTP
jgi:hypothetical protein